MLAVPPALLETLQLRPGSTVSVAVKGQRLIVQPNRRPRYKLAELLRRCDPKARRSKPERSWVSDRPVGGELL